MRGNFSGLSIPAGKLGDKAGARKTLLVGYVVLITSYFVLSHATTSTILVIGFLSLGIFSAFTDGIQRSLASQLSPKELRGGALGLVSAANGVGALIAGIGGGYLWQVYSPETAFIAASLLIAGGLFVFTMTLINGNHLYENK